VVGKKYVTGASTPSEGGLTPNQLKIIVKQSTKHNLSSLDIMEYNPNHDKNKKTLKIIQDILLIVNDA